MVAALAAVLVTAALGALGITREQSAIRQRERVTAVLKEMGSDAKGRDELEWLQGALARRVNLQYRAPRERSSMLAGWTGRLLGSGLVLYTYFFLTTTFLASVTSDDSGNLTPFGTAITLGAYTVGGVAAILVGNLNLRQRRSIRDRWVTEAEPGDSTAPTL